MKASLIVEEQLTLGDGKFKAIIEVYEVGTSDKYPDGIKASFVLVNIQQGAPILIIDNHEPFGFHIHNKLPQEHKHREPLQVKDHREARALFFDEIRRIIYEV